VTDFQQNNRRFETYCPFCQVSTTPSPLPQGLRDPPSYAPPSSSSDALPTYTDELPSYSSIDALREQPSEKPGLHTPPAEDVLHFLDHKQDSVTSLSLRYGVPITALRRANNLTSDHLLLARRTVVIPGEFYRGGVSLSPRPIEGEDEERRKAIVRRMMVACKLSEYDVALLYLEQVDYNLEAAIEAYRDDERWEKEHPMEINGKGKGKTRHEVGKRRFTGQKS
jgi:LysM repeat protein